MEMWLLRQKCRSETTTLGNGNEQRLTLRQGWRDEEKGMEEHTKYSRGKTPRRTPAEKPVKNKMDLLSCSCNWFCNCKEKDEDKRNVQIQERITRESTRCYQTINPSQFASVLSSSPAYENVRFFSLLTIFLHWRYWHFHHQRCLDHGFPLNHLLTDQPCGVSSLLSNIDGLMKQLYPGRGGGRADMVTIPTQSAVTSCIVFSYYCTFWWLRCGWINLRSLSLLYSVFLALSCLSFRCFSVSLCLPLSMCFSVLFPELLLAATVPLPFPTHTLSGPVNFTLPVSVAKYIHIET